MFTHLLTTAALLAAAVPAAQEDHLTLVNREVREVMWKDLYAVAVWSEDGELTEDDLYDDSRPKRLAVEVIYDGALPDIPESWSHELKPELSEEQWKLLADGYRTLEKGDKIVVTYDPETGTEMVQGEQDVLSDEGYGLMKGFLDIWFGEDPISEDFREEFIQD
ncbi:chalcone isomerase family protein [Parvularcula maris]|uniref:Chalcone isomerase family protein n=1 Tax=Parvularcula maris TaxID=2965077 RepID=A0A9X2RHK2_9PROT|nr:chalcone isomerase family protein [Parvularcula maris]MCQ8184964.1 chalcone isomerase family protein [Parvularcula maris]